jgi:F-type H+-transporting ATPase subunit a
VLYGYFGFSFFSLTNLSLILFFVLTFLAFFGLIYIQVGYTNVHYFFEGTFKLVKNILRENLNIKKQQYFAIVFYLFLVILLSNLVGLIPYSFTITSSFIVTFFIALTHFIGINLIGVVQHQ